MESAGSSETSVDLYQLTRHRTPEDGVHNENSMSLKVGGIVTTIISVIRQYKIINIISEFDITNILSSFY